MVTRYTRDIHVPQILEVLMEIVVVGGSGSFIVTCADRRIQNIHQTKLHQLGVALIDLPNAIKLLFNFRLLIVKLLITHCDTELAMLHHSVR